MKIRFKLFGEFKELVERDDLVVDVAPGKGLNEAIEVLIRHHSELDGRILDETKSLHSHALAFVNGQNTRAVEQSNPPLKEGDTVVLTPLVGGGSRFHDNRRI